MSRYTIEGETLTGIADAVRSITGGETLLTPAQIESEIEGTAATMQDDISELKTIINDKLDSPSTAGTSGQVLTSDGQGGQTWEDPTDAVEDVQINGTSVVNQGVANIPVATNSNVGAVQVDGSFGIAMRGTPNTHVIRVLPATSSVVKEGTHGFQPIVPNTQHESTFYGLAKAAGYDEKNSTNAFGTYTEEAKKAIRKMLGIPNMTSELIYETTTTENTDAITISTDLNGLPFKLRAMKLCIVLSASTTGTADYITVRGKYTLITGSDYALSFPTKRMSNATRSLCVYEMEAFDGMYFIRASSASNYSSSSDNVTTMNHNYGIKSLSQVSISQYSGTSTLIPAGTNIKLYGIRYDD